MDWLGAQVEIARFTFWWQVITSYMPYMAPIPLLLRGLSFHTPYAYGLIVIAFLEFGGYALGTSFVYPNNLLAAFFSANELLRWVWYSFLHDTFHEGIGW
jgi:hypothetical protein